MKKHEGMMAGMKGAFYLFFALVTLFFIMGTIFLPSETDSIKGECQPFWAQWQQILPDGSTKTVEVPGKCVIAKGETAVVETVLPDYMEDGKWLCFRSSQQDMRLYVDGQLRQEYHTKETRPFGKTSMSTYVFLEVSKEDVGKILRVEAESVSNFGGILNPVYYGDKFGIWEYYISQYGAEMMIAMFMLILAVICIVFSIALKSFHNKNIVLEYLGWGILLVAIWIITENRLRQLFFSNVSIVASMNFFALMLLPMPFLIYINSIQEFRYKKWYQILYAVAMADAVVCTLLQAFSIVDFLESMVSMHVMLLADILAIIVTIVLDIKKRYIRSYRLVAFGMVVLMAAGVVEISKVYINNGQVSGNGLCLGLIFLLVMAAIKTGQDLLKVDRERQRILLDNETKAGFLAKMSHEIRTPINTMIGMNEMIARESKDPAIELYVANAQEAGKTLLALVNDVLDFSRMESGHLNLTETVYQLASLINDEVHMVQARAEKKQLEVVVNVDKKLPSYLYGDEVRIKQIISNLLSNAVKYTEEGTITFSVGCMNNDDGEFFLKIAVADTGVGIQEKDMERLFDSFARLDEKKSKNAGGTGLGLNIIKQLLTEMQGDIKVRSVYGKGSLFTVVVPQKVIDAKPIGMLQDSFEEETAQIKKYRASFIAPQAKVLAVDDNEMNLEVVKGFLKRTQMQLDTAISGEKCLKLCKENAYHVILMDHMMPEPDGIQTLQLLRQQEGGCNVDTPVIVLTANAVAGSREEYLSDGFAEYLSKPISPERLEEVLKRFLSPELIIPQEEHKQEEPLKVEKPKAKEVTSPEPKEELISCKLGISYCGGDEEMYWDMLDTYHKQGRIYAEKLPQYFAQKDWKNYSITAHAMKSTSLSIGARRFSDIAKEHEMAGKEERASWIEGQWEGFYKLFLDVLATAEEMLKENAGEEKEVLEAEEVSKEDYAKECELLLEYLRNYEMNASVEQTDKLEGLTTAGMNAEEKTEVIKGIKEAIDEFDYTKAEELLEEWMKGVLP
ncbi:MAG: response regulator [Lachnospiraceae bacterium]|nr:response regulator [Lachnospiraceae bacterium]